MHYIREILCLLVTGSYIVVKRSRTDLFVSRQPRILFYLLFDFSFLGAEAGFLSQTNMSRLVYKLALEKC